MKAKNNLQGSRVPNSKSSSLSSRLPWKEAPHWSCIILEGNKRGMRCLPVYPVACPLWRLLSSRWFSSGKIAGIWTRSQEGKIKLPFHDFGKQIIVNDFEKIFGADLLPPITKKDADVKLHQFPPIFENNNSESLWKLLMKKTLRWGFDRVKEIEFTGSSLGNHKQNRYGGRFPQ